MNQFESVTARYFKLWQTKNIEGLSKLFEDSILLQDWDNLIKGKEAIMKFNLDFFNSVNIIELNVVSSHCFENTTFSELSIIIDGVKLTVLDKIVFNKNFLITQIRAFKG
tara:strand:- start:343 stop:672 length:330 start_codon:yes stop_codon:yes gene_type:complete